jgi:hypothetical protein
MLFQLIKQNNSNSHYSLFGYNLCAQSRIKIVMLSVFLALALTLLMDGSVLPDIQRAAMPPIFSSRNSTAK